jgi:hypothetical protein
MNAGSAAQLHKGCWWQHLWHRALAWCSALELLVVLDCSVMSLRDRHVTKDGCLAQVAARNFAARDSTVPIGWYQLAMH